MCMHQNMDIKKTDGINFEYINQNDYDSYELSDEIDDDKSIKEHENILNIFLPLNLLLEKQHNTLLNEEPDDNTQDDLRYKLVAFISISLQRIPKEIYQFVPNISSSIIKQIEKLNNLACDKQYKNQLKSMIDQLSTPLKMLNNLFQSITDRSAGFFEFMKSEEYEQLLSYIQCGIDGMTFAQEKMLTILYHSTIYLNLMCVFFIITSFLDCKCRDFLNSNLRYTLLYYFPYLFEELDESEPVPS